MGLHVATRTAVLLAIVVAAISVIGDAAAARVAAGARLVPPCAVAATVGPEADVCVVPDPGARDTLPADYDSGVRVTVPDVQYGPDPAQLLDLYLPDTTTRAPVVVYFHSGGWVAGSRTAVTQAILREVPRGYAVVSVDYRLAPAVRFPVPLQDAKTAVRWVKAHAAQYRLRADQVFAAGASAGGHLAAMVAVTPGRFEPTNLPPELAAQSSQVIGAVSLVGLLDLNSISREAGTWGPALVAALLGCPDPTTDVVVTCSEDAMTGASPLNYVTRDDPPIYLGYGDLDTLVPPSTNGLAMATRYAQLGMNGEAPFDEVQNQGHTLDIDGVNVTRLGAFLDGVRFTSSTRRSTNARGRV